MEIVHHNSDGESFTKMVRERLRQFNKNYLIGGYDKDFLAIPPIAFDTELLDFGISPSKILFGYLYKSAADGGKMYYQFNVPAFSHMGIYASIDMIEFFSHNPENNIRLRLYTESEAMEELKRWKKIKAIEHERTRAYLDFADMELKVQQALMSLSHG